MRRNGKALRVAALISFAGLALSLGVGLLLAADAPAPPAEGTTAPDFQLKSQEGKATNLRDFRGKWVVLYFYPKDFTTGCTIEAHGFQTDIAKYQAKGVQIVGVSVDSTDSHKDFCAKEGLNFTLLSDENHEVVAKYGSVSGQVAARNTFIIDPSGKIVKEFIKVNPTGHSAEVLAALDELQASTAKTGNSGGAAGTKTPAPAANLETPPQPNAAPAPAASQPAADRALIATGSDLFNRVYKCTDCHGDNSDGGDVGPKLAGIGSHRTVDELTAFLHKPSSMALGARMPPVDSDDEVKALIAYILSLKP
jgi:peroxiredoxin Q/BCP